MERKENSRSWSTCCAYDLMMMWYLLGSISFSAFIMHPLYLTVMNGYWKYTSLSFRSLWDLKKKKLWRFLACRFGDKPLNNISNVPAGFGQYWRSCPHSLVLRVKTKYSRREGGWPVVTMGTRNVCPLWYCFVIGGFGLNLLMSPLTSFIWCGLT